MNYPESAIELIKEVQYSNDVLVAMKKFRSNHVWKLSLPEKIGHMTILFEDLCRAYGVSGSIKYNLTEDGEHSFASNYNPLTQTITLNGKCSVITFLHEFAHLLFGHSEHRAVEWSVNLFKIIFPKSFGNLSEQGHCLIKLPSTNNIT